MAEPLPELCPVVVLQAGSTSIAWLLEEALRAFCLEQLEPVLGAPPALVGVALVGGEPTLVFDLPALLGVAGERSSPPATALLSRHRDVPIALLGGAIRCVDRLRVIPSAELPRAWWSRWGRAVEWRGRLLPLLDLGAAVEGALDGAQRLEASPSGDSSRPGGGVVDG